MLGEKTIGSVGRTIRGFLACGLALSAVTVASLAVAEDGDWQSKDEGKDKDKDRRVQVYRWNNEEETADQKGGYLGVQVQDITRALKRARDLQTDQGALVNRVENDSPADAAGIRRGDVIVSVEGKSIDDSGELIDAIHSLEPGKDVEIVVLRGDDRKTFEVELGERPKNQIGIAPGFLPRWRDSERTWSVPAPPPPGAHGERMDAERMEGLQETLRDLHEQLRVLRETEIPRLQEELRGLREELRQMNDDEGDRNDIRREGRRSRTPAED
jgi:membrane-associated protease RseP (regulator of RpoE activity)